MRRRFEGKTDMMRLIPVAILGISLLALGLLEQAIWSHPEPGGGSGQLAVAAANREFEAVDRFLASGDDTDLRDTLSVDFANWTSGSHLSTGFDGYRAQLETVRTLFPNLALKQTILGADDEVVTVRLTPLASEPASFAGARISARDLLGDTEVLRFAHGHLVERWGFPTVRGVFTPYPAAPAGSPTGAVPTRWTVPGSASNISAGGVSPLALLVERGALHVEIQRESSHKGTFWTADGKQHPVVAPTTLDLPAGAALCLPSGAIARIGASNDQPGTVLAMTLQLQTFLDMPHDANEPRPNEEELDPGGQIVLDGPSTELELGAVHLDQGSGLDIEPPSGSTLVLLETGTADMESPGQTATPFGAGDVHLATASAPMNLRITSPAGADLYLLHLAPPPP